MLLSLAEQQQSNSASNVGHLNHLGLSVSFCSSEVILYPMLPPPGQCGGRLYNAKHPITHTDAHCSMLQHKHADLSLPERLVHPAAAWSWP